MILKESEMNPTRILDTQWVQLGEESGENPTRMLFGCVHPFKEYVLHSIYT